MKDRRSYKGFSLIEILVAVALIIILATVTLVAINPAKNFRDTRNAQRSSDVAELLNAVTQYTSEEGHSVADFGTIAACTTNWNEGSEIGTATGNINLSTTLVDEYIVSIPKDPSNGTDELTGYRICLTTGGRVQVSAPSAEDGKQIAVKR